MQWDDAMAELTVAMHADSCVFGRASVAKTGRARWQRRGWTSSSVVAAIAPGVRSARSELPLPVRAVLAIEPHPRRGVEV